MRTIKHFHTSEMPIGAYKNIAELLVNDICLYSLDHNEEEWFEIGYWLHYNDVVRGETVLIERA